MKWRKRNHNITPFSRAKVLWSRNVKHWIRKSSILFPPLKEIWICECFGVWWKGWGFETNWTSARWIKIIFLKTKLHFLLGSGGCRCYDRLSPWDLFSSLLLLPTYVPTRTMSIPGGPVCILPGSPVLLSCALSSGRPYPCSSPILLLLNGVGSCLSISLSLVLPLCDPRGQYYLL